MQIPRYIQVKRKYYGTHDNLNVGVYIDTQDFKKLHSFSKFDTWEELVKHVPLEMYFLEVSEEEYNEAKGIKPVINNQFPIY